MSSLSLLLWFLWYEHSIHLSLCKQKCGLLFRTFWRGRKRFRRTLFYLMSRYRHEETLTIVTSAIAPCREKWY
ncbi:hypothetical protein BDB00DRAFT_216540 [Zychaea mexicana]|uniref:uncharacterized protein n=1 Tax=Zychaea mexicana TaxID=64656 RepID=UPI0022FECC4E|nr:uncharacterized protein BDB00DRAFT_216540 [Zychaea mexicana]KAI9472898.1 hypothetical protein BDB00DRAFT_216540 [Zychaea mexicana]